MTYEILVCIGCVVVAALIAAFVNPTMVKLAYSKRMLDNPNTRKLQKSPVPVIGGMGVYIAVVGAMLLANCFVPVGNIFIATSCLTIMFFVGFIDDMLGISFKAKFAFQIGVVFILWYFGYRLDNLNGIFGFWGLNMAASLVISIIAGVGLINAMNLIDGIDGLSSGLGIFTSIICGINFLLHGDLEYAVVAMAFVGALIPFFICNVFSRKYKMFIGDAGSLILGTLAYLFACKTVHEPIKYSWDNYNVSLLLTIYAIPVFDTLRVMTTRILKGHSPFFPDKTHLHHIFIAMQYPHVLVTAIILGMANLMLGIWILLSLLHLSVSWMTVISVTVAAMSVWSVYIILAHQQLKYPKRFTRHIVNIRRRGNSISKIYHKIQSLIEGHSYRKFMLPRSRKNKVYDNSNDT